MTNSNYLLGWNHPWMFADDGYDDYDYTACGSRRRFGNGDRNDSDYFGVWGDHIPNTIG